MKVSKLFICYVGILIGTILANLYLNSFTMKYYSFNIENNTGILTLMIKRSIEIVILVYIGMLVNKKLWVCFIDFMSGVILGIVASLKTMQVGLFLIIPYFIIILLIIILYNIVLKLMMTESQDKQEILNIKLHNSLINKTIVIAIIIVNAFLENFISKIF